MINNYWVNNYPMHVPSTIKLGNDTLISLLRQIVEKVPKNRAITCHGVNFNYEKFYAKVLLFAMALVKKGIQKGDRVAIMLPNSLQYPIAMFGILFAGAVVVNINPLYTEYEISYILEDSGSKAIIVLDLMAGKLNHLYDKFNLEFVVVTKIPDLYHSVKKFLMNLGIKYIKKLKVDYNYNACQFREMLHDNLPTKVGESKNIGSPMPVGLPQVGFDDLAFIQYTGATTGRPKGAMLSHDNIVANYKQCVAWLTPQVDPLNKHVVLNALPLYHIFSMTANLFTFLFCGSEIVMVMNPRDTCDLVNVMRKTKFNTFNALDTLYTHLMDSKYFLKFRYPYFKYANSISNVRMTSLFQM